MTEFLMNIMATFVIASIYFAIEDKVKMHYYVRDVRKAKAERDEANRIFNESERDVFFDYDHSFYGEGR